MFGRSEKRYKKLTLLHSNDLHGDFLAEQVDESLVGGVSRLSGYVHRARQRDPNVLYAISGDMFRGSVIDSEFQGLSTIQIMNLLGPDVVTIGNHEIDYGVAHLLLMEKCANFPIVNANFHITTNGRRLFEPHRIIQIGGMKVLFIGVITEQILASAKNDTLIGTFLNVEDAAVDVGRICNAFNTTDVDLMVLLTHIGFEEDKALAEQLDPAWGVDLIIGGHSHTLIDEPVVVNGIPIVQVGTGTDQLGRFDIVVDTKKNRMDSYQWQSIPLNDATAPLDNVLEDLILNYKGQTDLKYGRILTRLVRELTHPDRNRETTLGSLVSDALAESLGVDIMFAGSGSIRVDRMGPVITYGDLAEAFPYDGAIYQISVTGAQLERMVRHVLAQAASGQHCEFYQFNGGTRITFDRAADEFAEFHVAGEPLNADRIYTVGLPHYHFQNMPEFLGVSQEDCKPNGDFRTLATSARDVIEEYLISHNNLDYQIEGRLTVL
ncbi:MAG: bifunctional UDP-sugar hydrolase/5'-nucleotidase [Coriobacteriia bacterium]|nr:bifunctional UDP-sugar hydrolase/5'-nucleotidase [Coriobacteriia bacterium]